MINTKENREQLKNNAVELREQGSLDESISLFKEIITWDLENENFKGAVDVYGHLKISYLLKYDETSDLEFFKLAKNSNLDAIELAKEHNLNPSISQIHYCSMILKSEASTETDYLEALDLIDSSISTLKGSLASQAWPLNIKAKLLISLKKYDEALSVLCFAQEQLSKGYLEEKNKDDQFELKLNIWSSGILLSIAKIHIETNKPILARLYLNCIMNMEDVDYLVARKKEASELLACLK
jgi:hypothetical protein